MNALFLKDLAQKTHRGLRGRIEAGRSAGGKCYGYDLVRRIASDGGLTRGERAINPAEAAVVRRIFEMFAGGASPIAIAKNLNAEAVPGPQSRAWRDTTIRGHAGRGTGILGNELYAGRLIWNRLSYLKDPATGRRVSRPNQRVQLIAKEVPELRIVEEELWDQVQRRLQAIRSASGADHPEGRRFWESRRAQHVVTGKVFCGCCGGAMTNIGRDYLACSAARRQGVCDNRRGIQRQVLEGLVLEALTSRLMQPEHVATFVAEFAAEWNRLQAETSAAIAGKRRELEKVQRKLDRLLDAIADGLQSPRLQEKLDQLEAQRLELRQAIDMAPGSAPSLHPNLAETYRQRVEALQQAVAGRDGLAARDALRSLIERIVLRPSAGHGFEVELVGEIGAMIAMAQQNGTTPGSGSGPDLFGRSVKVVAGAGFEPAAFRL
jgi:site-specific DNA recombinase